MQNTACNLKPCVVILEPCTPQRQIALSAELKQAIHERNMLTSRTRQKFLSALDEIGNKKSVETKREVRKNQILQELLESEVVYLKQLETLMTYFMKPINENGILSNESYSSLFGKIENIYQVNGELLHELKLNLTNITGAFSKLAPFFKLYSVYAYDYKHGLALIEKLLSTNEDFSKLLLNQESRPEVQMKLISFLILPIQRIPRYCLLLQQVLDNSTPHDEDYESLKDCISKLQNVARHIDSLVEDQEKYQKLVELLRILKNGKELLISPGRNLIRQGTLFWKHSHKNKEKIYAILMTDVLMICTIRKQDLSQSNCLKCTCILPLSKCSILKSLKLIEIKCDEECVVLYHEENNETEVWAKNIEKTIEERIKSKQSFRKTDSLRKPARKQDLMLYSDPGISPGVTRIKRKQQNTNFDSVENARKQLKLSTTKRGLFSLTSRKPIHNLNEVDDSSKHLRRDSLFPFRQHFICASNNDNSEKLVDCASRFDNRDPEIFRFGEESYRKDAGFRFRMGAIFNGISNAFRRVLGLKS